MSKAASELAMQRADTAFLPGFDRDCLSPGSTGSYARDQAETQALETSLAKLA